MNRKKMRILMAVFGVALCAFSVGLFKAALFGVDPFQCFMAGLDLVLPIGFGTLYMVVSSVILVCVFFADRKYLGIATFVNLFLLGYGVDFTMWVLEKLVAEPSFPLRVVYIIAGVVILCFSSAFYFTADLGVSPYDAISLILADKNVAKFRVCRIGCDLICVIAGYALGAIVGVGTLITALFMGPLIDFFRRKVSEPWLEQYPV